MDSVERIRMLPLKQHAAHPLHDKVSRICSILTEQLPKVDDFGNKTGRRRLRTDTSQPVPACANRKMKLLGAK
jgi:hypothetical protein